MDGSINVANGKGGGVGGVMETSIIRWHGDVYICREGMCGAIRIARWVERWMSPFQIDCHWVECEVSCEGCMECMNVSWRRMISGLWIRSLVRRRRNLWKLDRP